MKILQVCKKFPFPIKDGESLAVMTLSESLNHAGAEIDLLAMNTPKHYSKTAIDDIGLKHYSIVKRVDVNIGVSKRAAFINLFQKSSYNIDRFIQAHFEEALIHMLSQKEYDVVQLESLYMAPYTDVIRKHSKSKIVMRSHNLEYEIWSDMAKNQKNPLLSWYYDLCAKRLLSYEKRMQNEYDALITISSTDLSKYKAFSSSHTPSYCIPVGLDTEKYNLDIKSEKGTQLNLGYLGSLDWTPNIKGLKWFFESIWSKISHLNFEFHLAGRNPYPEIERAIEATDNIKYKGEVESAIEFLKGLDIVVVPLLSGSGIRIKILEAMALAKPVLATPKAFEGINVSHGINGFVFKDFKSFDNIINQIGEDRSLLLKIGKNARKFVENEFSAQVLGKKLINIYNRLIA